MTTFFRWAAVSACMTLLAGCSSFSNPLAVDQAGARAAIDKGTPFQVALHQEYLNLTTIESNEADWSNARYFADRARLAAAGQSFGPTDVNVRSIKADRVDEATGMRNRVVTALGGDTTTRAPQLAAHLQAMYDCWLEEVDEANQPKDEADCLEAVNVTMAQLVQPRAAAPSAPVAAAPPPAPARSFVVFFDFDKADISASAKPTVDTITAQIKQQNPRTISIEGNADRSGSDDYNLRLSRRRSDAVASALASQGANRSAFKIESYGEARPLVVTADGVREPQNRRVEVKFQ